MSREVSVPDVSRDASRIGEVIDDRYELVEHLADGGMASVYRAEQLNTRVSFAMKVLSPEMSGHREVALRFQREVRAYRSVQHPHIVSAIDFGRLQDGCPYMVLEYIRGKDLFLLLQETKPLAQQRAVKIASEIAEALICAHGAGVVHRDLKPENIMLIERDGDPDYVKVVDFGIAKMPARDQAITAPGSIFGTPEYMAPEQARGGDVDHRTDLYAFGVLLYEMLAGQAPFTGPRPDEIILAHLKERPPPLPDNIDTELRELTLKLLEKEPSARIQSASELSASLRTILARLSTSGPDTRRRREPAKKSSAPPSSASANAKPRASQNEQEPSPAPANKQNGLKQAETPSKQAGSSAWQVVLLLLCMATLAGFVAFLFSGQR